VKKTNIKHLELTLALLIATLLTLGFVASTVGAWDLPDLPDWDLPDLPDLDPPDLPDLPDWDLPDLPDLDPPDLPDLPDWESYWENFREKLEEDLGSAIEMARNTPYLSESWDSISQEMERQLCEDYDDPAKVGELERRRGLVTEGAIIAIKMIPVYDPRRRQVRTFGGFAVDLVNGSSALAGSDLAEDPVRCAALLLLDSDYLSYAKIIKTNDEKWISIEEAKILGYKTNEVNAANSAYLQAQNAFALGDSELVESHMKTFCSAIQEINSSQNQGLYLIIMLWLLPSGLIIGAVGIIVYRNKTKEDQSTCTTSEENPSKSLNWCPNCQEIADWEGWEDLVNMANFANSESLKSDFAFNATLACKVCEYKKKIRLPSDIPAILRAQDKIKINGVLSNASSLSPFFEHAK